MNIIYATLQQLQSSKWYGVSRNVEIAKGKNKLGFRLSKIKRLLKLFFKK